MPNPLLNVATQAARDLIRLGAEFGLTPSARAKVAAAGYEEDFGKFNGLIA